MSEQVVFYTDAPTLTATDYLDALIAEGEIEDARRKTDEADKQAMADAARRAKHAEAWRPTLEAIYAALPPWLHPFLSVPDDDIGWLSGIDAYYLRSATLALPDLAPIYVYADPNRGDHIVRFDVPTPEIQRDEYGDGDWFVYWRGELVNSRAVSWAGMASLPRALYLAQQRIPEYAQRQLEADARNQAAARKAAQPAAQPPMPPDAVAAHALNRIADVMETWLESMTPGSATFAADPPPAPGESRFAMVRIVDASVGLVGSPR